jgi:hypothetical protein
MTVIIGNDGGFGARFATPNSRSSAPSGRGGTSLPFTRFDLMVEALRRQGDARDRARRDVPCPREGARLERRWCINVTLDPTAYRRTGQVFDGDLTARRDVPSRCRERTDGTREDVVKITFLSPHVRIAGGVRAILTYAHRLAARGPRRHASRSGAIVIESVGGGIVLVRGRIGWAIYAPT